MSWILGLNVQRRCRRAARPNTGRNVRPAIEYCNAIGLILGLSNNGSRWVSGPPSLLLTYIYIDLRPAYGVGTVGDAHGGGITRLHFVRS